MLAELTVVVVVVVVVVATATVLANDRGSSSGGMQYISMVYICGMVVLEVVVVVFHQLSMYTHVLSFGVRSPFSSACSSFNS